jgi:acyl-homoserine-lactone acylase
MRMRALVSQNFTYADRTGVIYILWNAAIPWLPHPTGGDTTATPRARRAMCGRDYVPFEALPQQRNPKGGYLQNENDSPHYANVAGSVEHRQRLSEHRAAPVAPAQPARDRTDRPKKKWSLEDVVRLKHSTACCSPIG